ncbi:MAG: hypothetical protein KF765_02220 [Parvibaculaceae bacterium]|nr:hypothetical protein [Parvibaculaceae bacterium]
MGEDAGAGLKARLRADLLAAMKGRRTMEVKLIRALVAAVDNAEAVPLRPGAGLDGASPEAERLLLDAERVRAILQAEIEEREHAARNLEHLGQVERGELLRAEARAVRRYLD